MAVPKSAIRSIRTCAEERGDAWRIAVCTLALEGPARLPTLDLPREVRTQAEALDPRQAATLAEQWVREARAAARAEVRPEPPPQPPPAASVATPPPRPESRRARVARIALEAEAEAALAAAAKQAPEPAPPAEPEPVATVAAPPAPATPPDPHAELRAVFEAARRKGEHFKAGVCLIVLEGREAALALEGLPESVRPKVAGTSLSKARAHCEKWVALARAATPPPEAP